MKRGIGPLKAPFAIGPSGIEPGTPTSRVGEITKSSTLRMDLWLFNDSKCYNPHILNIIILKAKVIIKLHKLSFSLLFGIDKFCAEEIFLSQ